MFSILFTLLFIHMLAVLLLESPYVIIFFIYIYYICAFYAWYAIYYLSMEQRSLFITSIICMGLWILKCTLYQKDSILGYFTVQQINFKLESTLHILLDSKSYCLNYFNYFSLIDLAHCFSFFSITILTYLYIAKIPFFQLFSSENALVTHIERFS